MRNYHINLFYRPGDGGWIADVPDLKYCSAHGERPEDALREIKVAMKLRLATARQQRKPVPRASYRPAIYQLA
jgi:predicted RNase H-like HicB family nuclease